MTDSEETRVPRVMRRYPPAEVSPREFEDWVGDVFRSLATEVDDLEVSLRDRIERPDGTFEIDATVRYSWGGLDFLILVEAKLHTNPIKRDVVQVLHSKVRSVGAHKGVLVSTAPFQSGALNFALAHGIALITVTEGRFTFQTRSLAATDTLTRAKARELGIPPFVGHAYTAGSAPRTTAVSLISLEHPRILRELLGG